MNQKIGILGSMPEEVEEVVSLLNNVKKRAIGLRTFYEGDYKGTEVVVGISGWGKVASAVSVSVLIHEFHISELIFTGVAGGLQKDLRIGDIVVGSRLVQHDMDARPLLKRFEISTLNQIFMESPREQVETAKQAVESLIQDDDFYAHLNALESLQLQKPRLFVGDIASGDQFFACTMQKEALLSVLPTVLCVEMEGASVAQVCCEYALPFTIIRIISDSADENSSVDFVSFIKEIAGKYSIEIIKHILNHSFRNKKTG
jgi:adenosylhomocysteine nucleosidase